MYISFILHLPNPGDGCFQAQLAKMEQQYEWKKKGQKISFCDEIEMEALRLHRGETQSCIWGSHNSTFTLLGDLTALKRQCLWPSCRIPISGAYATVEMKREQGLYSAPGLSDYCLKTRVFLPVTKRRPTQGVQGPSCSNSPRAGFWRAHLITAFSHSSYAAKWTYLSLFALVLSKCIDFSCSLREVPVTSAPASHAWQPLRMQTVCSFSFVAASKNIWISEKSVRSAYIVWLEKNQKHWCPLPVPVQSSLASAGPVMGSKTLLSYCRLCEISQCMFDRLESWRANQASKKQFQSIDQKWE